MSGQNPSRDLEDKLRVYTVYRQKTVDEYGFINHRMSWMIWSEALILALWGVMASPDRLGTVTSQDPWLNMTRWAVFGALDVLSVCGMLLAYLTWRSVRAAMAEVEFLKQHYKDQHGDVENDQRVPILTGQPTHHRDGHIVPIWLPVLFGLIQSILITYSVMRYLSALDATSRRLSCVLFT